EKRIVTINRAAEELFGVSADEVEGRSCRSVLHSDLCLTDCPVERTFDAEDSQLGLSAQLSLKGGRLLPASINTRILRDETGQITGVIEVFRDESENQNLRRDLSRFQSSDTIIGQSSSLRRVLALLPDLAASEANVLIEGETGTGKDLFAQAIHRESARSTGPYVVVNCGAFPESLFESELFGYVKGAFTDARSDKPGWLEKAQGGTLVLDEVSELPMLTQVKLLRVLQQREYAPLGTTQTKHLDCRLVAISNRDLSEAAKTGLFRDDLYFRLAVLAIHIPALRDRKEDIPLLVHHILEGLNGKGGKVVRNIAPSFIARLLEYDFPGNIRELENMVEAAFVYTKNETLRESSLPKMRGAQSMQTGVAEPLASTLSSSKPSLARAEADEIREALSSSGGSATQASRLLNIGRSSMYRKMKEYGIQASDFKESHSSQSIDEAAAYPLSFAEEYDESKLENKRPKVLFIDDDLLVRRVFSRMHNPVCDVILADGGEEALNIMRSQPEIDLVICDFMMPNMDGSQVFEAVARDFPSLISRFVFLTGAVADSDRSLLETRFDRPIYAKPFMPGDLDAELATHLR
ncbi:sigma 54-interacting transcriptional regulator, partial [Myxococcota bacterium]|nr:sigma 54-interacting transcriptional regulator [Myxococcota bacterium]